MLHHKICQMCSYCCLFESKTSRFLSRIFFTFYLSFFSKNKKKTRFDCEWDCGSWYHHMCCSPLNRAKHVFIHTYNNSMRFLVFGFWLRPQTVFHSYYKFTKCHARRRIHFCLDDYKIFVYIYKVLVDNSMNCFFSLLIPFN